MKKVLLFVEGFFRCIPVVTPKFIKLHALPYQWAFLFCKSYFKFLNGDISRSEFKQSFEKFRSEASEEAPQDIKVVKNTSANIQSMQCSNCCHFLMCPVDNLNVYRNIGCCHYHEHCTHL
jgi:hypothetical protein